MRTTLRTGQRIIAVALCLGLAPAIHAQGAVYGPKLEPATFDPQGEPREQPQRNPVFLKDFFKKLPPYEQAVSDWKNRQYGCMKKGSLCFENRPLPSDLLQAPSVR